MIDPIIYTKEIIEGFAQKAKDQVSLLENASSAVVGAMESIQNGVDIQTLASQIGAKVPSIEELVPPDVMKKIENVENLSPNEIAEIAGVEIPTLEEVVKGTLGQMGVPENFGNFLKGAIDGELGADLIKDSIFPPVQLQSKYSIVYSSDSSCTNMTNCVNYVNVQGGAYVPTPHEGLIVLALRGKASRKIGSG